MSGRKIFIIKIALSLLLCVGLVSPIIAQINQSSVNPEVYETIVIPKTYNVPTLYLYQSTWLVQDTIKLQELTIAERAVLKAPEGKYLTLAVNGIGKQIKPGTYKGDVVISVSDNYLAPSVNATKNPRNFHTAILIDNGKVVPQKSTLAVVNGGEVTDTKAEGIYIGSEEESFNGIVVDGNSEYTISNVKIDLDGFADNDFIGVGSAVATYGNSKVTINDSEFNVNGVTRSALHVGGQSVVTLNNCKLFRYSPVTDWMGGFSWQVGFRGTGRVAQLADSGTVYYNNCYIKGNGTWCLLSIDNAQTVKIVVKDSTLELDGPGAHGYGVFCIGSGQEVTYDHSTFDVNGYPLIMMGMGKSRADIINGCLIKGRRFGVFCCGDNNSVVTIKDSTFQTDKSNLCIKGSSTTFNIDNAVMNAKNGVIVQLMDTEENGMAQQEYRIPVGVVDVAIPGRDLTTASPTEDVKINIANSKIQGNFFNSTTNIHAEKNSPTGGMGTFHDNVMGTGASQAQKAAISGGRGSQGAAPQGAAPEGESTGQTRVSKDPRGPKNLALSLTNVKVEGIISSATQAYREGLAVITAENREDLSNVTQTAADTVNNGVIVSLDKDSVWIVTGTSYITALTIAKGAEVKAPEGKSLTMTVDGVKKTIAAGTYKGKIQMVVN